ncbi:MAG: AAA family ATPase [Clostridiales bacterium]|nr:AAA family ATPase [Clostridiales bacterium]
MAKIYSISNQKGGVGKTTTTSSIAAALKERGYKVLVIDLDPQGNLGFCLGADIDNKPSIYEVLKGELKTQFAVQKVDAADIIISSILLSAIELEFTNTGREFLMKEALANIKDYYDYILIDTPPNLGILTVNAFTASDAIIVPMLSDIFSLQGIAQLFETVERVRKYCNPKLYFAGILLTKFNKQALLSREVLGTAELIANDLHIPIFKTQIRSSIKMSEAQSLQQTIMEYAPKNNVAKDYNAFVEELLTMESERDGKKQKRNR